jgi:ribosomal protein S18 acetylase RimI-like enzyme
MISIRKSTVKDIPILAEFQQLLAAETENVKLDAAIVQKGLQALFDDPSKGVYYIAESEKEIIGCHLITYEWSDWKNGMVWWLQSVYVKAAYRKRGVFRFMYDNLVTQIRQEKGIIGLRLYVDKSNVKAQEVYRSIGMNGDHYTVFEWMKGDS